MAYKRRPKREQERLRERGPALESLRWRTTASRALELEPVDCRAVCPSGTLVVALLRLAVPMSEIARVCGISVDDLRATVSARLAPFRVEPLADDAVVRLGAFLGAAVARGLPEAKAIAEAEALAVGCFIAI